MCSVVDHPLCAVQNLCAASFLFWLCMWKLLIFFLRFNMATTTGDSFPFLIIFPQLLKFVHCLESVGWIFFYFHLACCLSLHNKNHILFSKKFNMVTITCLKTYSIDLQALFYYHVMSPGLFYCICTFKNRIHLYLIKSVL